MMGMGAAEAVKQGPGSPLMLNKALEAIFPALPEHRILGRRVGEG